MIHLAMQHFTQQTSGSMTTRSELNKGKRKTRILAQLFTTLRQTALLALSAVLLVIVSMYLIALQSQQF